MMFEQAKPIWIKNKRLAQNLQCGFRCDFYARGDADYRIKLTGATLYRVFLNGEFAGYGPARAGYGYIRCDEFILKPKEGVNKLAIEVAGYNCASFYTMKMKSFLCAEIYENEKVTAFTGRDFKGLSLEKLRSMECHRYSYQRAYGEVWSFNNSSEITNWKVSDNLPYETLILCDAEGGFIERGVPTPDFDIDNSAKYYEEGHILHKLADNVKMPRYIKSFQSGFDAFTLDSFASNPITELYGVFVPSDLKRGDAQFYSIKKDKYVKFKTDFDNTGFIQTEIIAEEDSDVYLFFTECDYKNSIVFDSIEGQVNIVKYSLKKSDMPYKLETFETYTFRYIGIAVRKGKIKAAPPKIREYSYPLYRNTEFSSSNDEFNDIFKAAVNTFRQNTLDVYMDCPGRERGGWLCDSYFTAQSEKLFAGSSKVENAFLSNFTMAKEFPNLPQGMLPHNYPSSLREYNSGYIPQWAMWYFAELYEYVTKRCGKVTAEHKRLFYDLLAWFKQYENEDGLLEKMPGWNFVEWSAANDWVQDVNYPTNMLYSMVLRQMGELFEDKTLVKKSENIKNKIIEQSFNGKFFTDNAIRNESGQLINMGNISETCQYYAYFCGVADENDERFKQFTDILLNEFGGNKIPAYGIEPSAPFIGKYLRLVMLMRMKKFSLILDNISEYFIGMARLTGTLWENDTKESLEHGGSLNHGFASFAGVALAMACAGISDIDYTKKIIYMDSGYLCGYDYDIKTRTDDGDIKLSCRGGKRTSDIPKEWTIKSERRGLLSLR